MKPVVASYSAVFLLQEMLHIYRQVTGLKRYQTFVITRERANAEQFPFADIEIIEKFRKNFLKRFYLKHLRQLPPVRYRPELRAMTRLMERRSADLMHIYFGHTGVHWLPFIQSWDKPCVVSFHGADIQPRPQQENYGVELREMFTSVPLVLGRSKSLLLGLEQLGCPKEKLRLNRTGIPLEQFPFQQRPMPVDGSWRFVQACRLVAKKGIGTAIRAFARFHELFPKSKFCIAGDGPLRAELTALVDELSLTESVELCGFLSQADLSALYSRAHLFLHPSEMPPDQNQEGVPNSMLEAMATGLPVLATEHGGIPEAVTHERTGLLVAERDHTALFRAMCQITEQADFLYILGQAASRAVRENFEHEKALEKLESFYDEAVELGAPIRLRA